MAVAHNIWDHQIAKKIMFSRASREFKFYALYHLSKKVYTVSKLAKKFEVTITYVKTNINFKRKAIEYYKEHGISPNYHTYSLTFADVELYKSIYNLLPQNKKLCQKDC